MLSVPFYSSYSYSETVFGNTANQSDVGYNWVMQNILPQQAGLEVSSVIYRYRTIKNTEDDMVVYVQNEDAQNEGQYIFREVDDWSGKPGNTINKIVPVDNILIDRWGDGSIEWTGQGTVEDARVVYNYQFDPCFDPQSSPDCPGYVPVIPDIPEPDLTALYDQEAQFIDEEIEKETELEDEDQKEKDRKKNDKKQKVRDRLQLALGANLNALQISGDAQQKHDELLKLSIIPVSYTVSLSGGVYEETTTLNGGKLPKDVNAKRVGLAQQLLHKQLVDSQYENK